MEKRILMGNNISDKGRKLARGFRNLNLDVTVCSNGFGTLREELEKSHYDAIIFFIRFETPELLSFIRYVRAKYGNTAIYGLLCSDFTSEEGRIMRAGVKRCYRLPLETGSFHFSIIKDFMDTDRIYFPSNIANFLISREIPTNIQAFYFLTLCVEAVVFDYDMLNDISETLYGHVSEIMGGVSKMWIERSIRNLTQSIYNKGIRFECYPDEFRLSNKELIKALADEYKKKNFPQ